MLENNKENQQKILNEITGHALAIYGLMPQGMTIDITFPDANAILIPNQLPKVRRLIITKPKVHIDLSLQPLPIDIN